MFLVQEHHARSYSWAPCKTCGGPGKTCAWCWDGAVYLNIFLVQEHYARSYSQSPCKTLRLLLGQSCGRTVSLILCKLTSNYARSRPLVGHLRGRLSDIVTT